MIRPFIVAAMSADGFIAKDHNHAAFWTSKEDRERYNELIHRAGVVIMGSRTFSMLPRAHHEVTNIVYSHNKKFEGAEVTTADPYDLLTALEERGFTEAAIIGGGEIFSLFLAARAVHKIYIAIEPLLFGKGIPLFDTDMHVRLELVSVERTVGGTILAEYSIKYHGSQFR
jgi:dihydrofolate reductase